MHLAQPDLAVLDRRVRFGDVHAAVSDGLHLAPAKHDPRLVPLRDDVVERRRAVLRDVPLRVFASYDSYEGTVLQTTTTAATFRVDHEIAPQA